MSDKEKEIIQKIAKTLPTLDKEKQNYVLGIAEGMAIAREHKEQQVEVKDIA